jgi:cytosine/uracil/thiamine/allantoin permease
MPTIVRKDLSCAVFEPACALEKNCASIWPQVRAVFVCLILFLAVSVAAFAQVDISASLAGTVTDQTGAVVPNAAVTALNVQTGVSSKTTSNEPDFTNLCRSRRALIRSLAP